VTAILHELRNQLAIAVANVEAFIDGKLEPTPRRLRSISDALTGIEGLLTELAEDRLRASPAHDQIAEICAIISNEVVAIAAASEQERVKLAIRRVSSSNGSASNVASYSDGSGRVGQVVNDLLLNAIRHTPSGGAIVVDCHRERDSFAFSVSNEAAEHHADDVANVHGGTISIVSRPGDGATFTIRLLNGTLPALARTSAPSELLEVRVAPTVS